MSAHRRLDVALACMAAALTAASLVVGDAAAQAPTYAGRTITLIVGSSPGGYYDVAGRVVAHHLARFLPGNPSIVVQNQPGAGGLAGVNRLGNMPERDGRTILVMSRALPQLALLGDPNAAFDPLQLTWLGSLSSYKDDAYLMIINARHPAHALADLRGLRPAGVPGRCTKGGSTQHQRFRR